MEKNKLVTSKLEPFPNLLFRTPTHNIQGTGVSEPYQIGKDYIPNMNCQMMIKVPFQSDQHIVPKLTAAGISASSLPATFNWCNAEHVQQYMNKLNHPLAKKFDPSWICKPPNQSTCGSCWAVSSTTAHTDRITIATLQPCPLLSFVATASCATHEIKGDGCQGGFPSDAGCYFEQIGAVPMSCWNYDTFCPLSGHAECSTLKAPYMCCDDKKQQKATVETPNILNDEDKGDPVNCLELAQRIRGCTSNTPGNPTLCQDKSTIKKRYFAAKGSTVALSGGDDLQKIVRRMKLNIYAGGPVVGCYFVYGDFLFPHLFGKDKYGWRHTNNIYCHIPKQSPYVEDEFIKSLYDARQNTSSSDYHVVQNAGISFGNSLDEFKKNVQDYYDSIQGAHAVVVVGWGEGDTKYEPVKNTGYWICRNSWGTDWNEGGFFRIAYKNPSRSLNEYSNMEQFMDPDTKQVMGGATTWSISMGDDDGGSKNSKSPKALLNLGTSVSNQAFLSHEMGLKNYFIYIYIGLGVLAFIIFAYVLTRRRR